MTRSRRTIGRSTTRAPVVLVTGASSGIGAAVADLLARDGARVVGASRHPGAPVGWEPLVMDVDRDDSVEAGVADVHARHGRIDAVVTAAGWGLAGPVERTTIDAAKAQLETNFWGTVRVVRATLPIMRQQGGGRIVLISSIAGMIGVPFQAYYSASKFALEGFAESLAYEVDPYGIHVTLVQPGNVHTGFTDSRRTVDDPGPYREACDRAVATMAEDEVGGAPASTVAATVQRVLTARRPPRRATAGKLDERLGVVAKRLLPHAAFERIARDSLGV